MHFVAPGLSTFHGPHQTTEQQSRFKVTDERKRGNSNRGWKRRRQCSRRTVTHPHGQKHQYMYVIYRKDAHLLFQDFHLRRCMIFSSVIFDVSPQKKEKALFYCLWCNSIIKWVPSLLYFSLLSISSSLIKSYLQAKGGRSQGDQYATRPTLPHAHPSLFLTVSTACPLLFPNSLFPCLSPLSVPFFFGNYHYCQQPVPHLSPMSRRL